MHQAFPDDDLLVEPDSRLDPGDQAVVEDLLARLSRLAPDKKDWSLYQSTCSELLAYLLAPPLNYPLSESAN